MKLFWRTLVVGSAVAGLGCGGFSTEPTGDLLNEAEVQAISEAVIGAALTDGFDTGSPGSGSAFYGAPPVSFDFAIDQTVPCAQGGTVQLDGAMEGDVDSDTGEGTLSVRFTQTHSDCGVTTDEHGVFFIDGDPNIELSGDLQWGAEGPEGTSSFTYRGGFAWSQDDRSGTCGIDVELTFTATSASYSGSVCGADFSANVEIG